MCDFPTRTITTKIANPSSSSINRKQRMQWGCFTAKENIASSNYEEKKIFIWQAKNKCVYVCGCVGVLRACVYVWDRERVRERETKEEGVRETERGKERENERGRGREEEREREEVRKRSPTVSFRDLDCRCQDNYFQVNFDHFWRELHFFRQLGQYQKLAWA